MRLQGSHNSTLYEDVRHESLSSADSIYDSGALHLCGRFTSRTDSDCSDYFVKTVRVHAIEHDDWQVARATFDTGSIHNWVSKIYLTERLRIPLTPLSHEQKRLFVAFNGSLVSAIGAVQLTWYGCSTHGRKSCVSTFLVADEDVQLFDLLIGSTTIVKERILTWDVGAVWTLLSTPLVGKKERENVEHQMEIIASNRQPLIEESDRHRNAYRARKSKLYAAAYDRAVQDSSSLQRTASASPSRSAISKRPANAESTIPESRFQPVQNEPTNLITPAVGSSVAQQNLNATALPNSPQPSSTDIDSLAILERVSSRGLNTQPPDAAEQELSAAIPLPDQSTSRYTEAVRQAERESRGMRLETRPTLTDQSWQRRRRRLSIPPPAPAQEATIAQDSPAPAQEAPGVPENQDPLRSALPNGVVPKPKGAHRFFGKLFHKKT